MIEFYEALEIFTRKEMIYTNTLDVPGRKIAEILGIVTGNVVQSKQSGEMLWLALNHSSAVR